jgi:hypothetical protein
VARRGSDAWLGRYRSALASSDLRRLLGSLVVSATCSWAYNVALLAFVYERTHSLGWVGTAGVARLLPAVLFSAYAGVIAERTERVGLMVRADLLCAFWQVGLAIVAATEAPVVLALVLSALTTITNLVYLPSVAATIPSVVDEDELVSANALNGTIENLVVIVGPAVGAALLAIGSAESVFGLNAASFLASAMLVSRMSVRSRPVDVTEAGAAGPLRQMAVGVRTIAALPAARTLVAFCALVSFVHGTDTVLYVGASVERLGTGPEGFGYLMGGLGVGGILMATTVDKLAGSQRLALIILAGVAGYCLPTALLTVIHSPALATALQVIRGGSTLVVDVLAVTALQRAVPGEQLARVFGVFFAFVIGAIALGALITPPIVSGLGLDGALLVMAFAPFALGLLGLPALLAIDRQTGARAAQLAPRVAILESLAIFASAGRPVLERLAGAATEVQFPGRTVIAQEGDPADALYVLVEGEVFVKAHGELAGPDRPLRTMLAPTYFGEIGVLAQMPRTATVIALGTCRCLRIDGDALREALTGSPPSSALMENARRRLAVTHPSRPATFAVAEPA